MEKMHLNISFPEIKITRVNQINQKTRFLPPDSLIVENVFFIVLRLPELDKMLNKRALLFEARLA